MLNSSLSNIFEITLLSLFPFVYFSLFILPVGQIVCEYFLRSRDSRIQIVVGLGYSLIFYSLLLTLLLALSFSPSVMAWVLRGVTLISLLYWILRGGFFRFFNRENVALFSLFFFYFLLTLSVSSFPDLNYRNVSADLTQRLLSLPVDNIIPYNFSRYILESISPSRIDIVHLWKASDRGPIGGLMNAASFLILGIQENQNWSEVSPGLYFIYQALLSYLNLFSFLAVWFVTAHVFGRKAASISLLILITGCFYFVNIIFSWPKFLMAYFVFVSVFMHLVKINPFVIGVMMGAAVLSHDAGIFYVAGLGLLFCVEAIKNVLKNKLKIVSLKPLFLYVLGYVLINIPWSVFKKYYSAPSPRLLYLHLFCDTRVESSNVPLLEELKYYLANNTLMEILSTRLGNLYYPFDMSSAFYITEINLTVSEYIVTILNNLPGESFHRFIWGFGFIPFLLIIYSLIKSRKLEQSKKTILLTLFFTIFSALIFASFISGCSGNTTNHHWAYPIFLAAAFAVGSLFSIENKFNSIFVKFLLSFSVALNIFTSVLYIHYHSLIRPVLHGTVAYFIFQAVVSFLCLGLVYCLGRCESQKEDEFLVNKS